MTSEEPNIDKAIVSSFKITPEHLLELLDRYRAQHRGRLLWTWFRILLSLLFLTLAFFFVRDQGYAEAALFGALTIVMFVSPRLDNYLFISRLKKSPQYNTQQTLTFSQSGVIVESEVEKGEIRWNAFEKSVIFDDGVLLFKGMGLLEWIPNWSIENDEVVRLRDLVSSNTKSRTR